MCRPHRSKSSAVFTTIERSPGGSVLQTARKLRAAYPAGERTDLHRGPGRRPDLPAATL